MKLQGKMLMAFMAVTLITICVGVFAISKMEQMEEADARLYTRATEPMKDLVSMMENFMKMRILLRELVLDEEIKDFKPYLEEIATMRSTFSVNLKNVEVTLISANSREQYERFMKVLLAYRSSADKLVNLATNRNYIEAKDFMLSDTSRTGLDLQKEIKEMVATKVSNGKRQADDNRELAQFSARLLYGAIGFGVLFSLALGILLTRSVLKQWLFRVFRG